MNTYIANKMKPIQADLIHTLDMERKFLESATTRAARGLVEVARLEEELAVITKFIEENTEGGV